MVETKIVHKPITANKRDVFFFFYLTNHSYIYIIVYIHTYKWCNSTVLELSTTCLRTAHFATVLSTHN